MNIIRAIIFFLKAKKVKKNEVRYADGRKSEFSPELTKRIDENRKRGEKLMKLVNKLRRELPSTKKMKNVYYKIRFEIDRADDKMILQVYATDISNFEEAQKAYKECKETIAKKYVELVKITEKIIK